jgi:hypothetical protein
MTPAGYILTQEVAYDVTDNLTQEGNAARPDPKYAGSELNRGKVGYSARY